MMDDETNDGRSAKLKYEVKDFSAKSTTDDIAARFAADVERFSNLESGQSATIDAPLSMQLITAAAVRLTPKIAKANRTKAEAASRCRAALAPVHRFAPRLHRWRL